MILIVPILRAARMANVKETLDRECRRRVPAYQCGQPKVAIRREPIRLNTAFEFPTRHESPRALGT